MSINFFPKQTLGETLKRNTAFGELRVTNPQPKIQLDFPYNINSRLINDRSGGGGTLTQASGMAICSTSASTNASGVLLSRRFLNYNPGQGGLARFTSLYTEGAAGSIQCMGLGEELDGYFFGFNGTEFSILRRRNGEAFWTPQSEWTEGTFSGFDPTLGNVYQICYQWLGFGGIAFFIEDPQTSEFELVHIIKYANANLEPSILNPSLPLCVFAHNITNETNIVLKTSSMAAFVEGDDGNLGIPNASGIAKDVGTTLVPLISLRNNSTFQGVANRTVVDIVRAFGSNEGNQTVVLQFFINSELTGDVFQEYDSATSSVSLDINATSFVNGIPVGKSLIGPLSSEPFDFESLNISIPPGETMTIAAERLSGAASTVDAGFIWKETP